MAKANAPVQSLPKKMIAVPRKEYVAFMRWQKKIRLEMKDADTAIAIAEHEKKSGNLKLARSFSAILKPARTR